MAVDAIKTVAVGRRTCFVVMLAQTGSPTRAIPQIVGIFQTAMTPHTRNEVDTVHGNGGTTEVYHSAGRPSAAVAGITAGANIRIIQVGVVETGSPVKILRRRYVRAALPEAGVTLGALPLVVDGV
jgi:hypothetical protein